MIDILLPTFFAILVGYIIGKVSKSSFAALVDVSLYVGAPALVFVSLLNKDIVLLEAGKVWVAAVVIMFGCGLVSWVVFQTLKQKHSGLHVSVATMNSMNIPFPIIYLAYGAEGLIVATLFYIPNTLIMNSLGIYIMAGKHWRKNIKEVFKVPIIYAAVIGLIINLLGIKVPSQVVGPLELLSRITVPLVLIVLGYNLSRVKITSLPTTVLASFLRMGVGFGIGLLIVSVLHITGLYRTIVIFDSAMPAAATASLLATKYDNEAGLVSSVVFLTTLASLVVIPFLLHWLA
jgi:predicted permease